MTHDSTPMASTSTLHDHAPESAKPEIPDRRQPNASGSSNPSTSQTAAAKLPAGCCIGPQLYLTPHGRVLSEAPEAEKGDQPDRGSASSLEPVPIIWVEFPPDSPENPFSYSRKRKTTTMACALFFAGMTALQASAYAPGIPSMRRDLGMTQLQADAGVSLFPWVGDKTWNDVQG